MTRYVRVSHGDDVFWGRLDEDHVTVFNRPPWGTPEETGGKILLSECKLLAPAVPSKIVLVGLNYHEHIKESQSASAVPEEPIIFLKPPTAIIGPSDEVIYPDGLDRVDYEGELAAVIGEEIHQVDSEKARSAIFGYTCLNDVTARHLQRKDVQWTRAKGFDGFAPIGPWIVTDIDPLDLKIETYLNEELRQSSRTSYQIWNVYSLVSFISNVMTLLPGDVVSTGTPRGIGAVQPGDVVKITIEKIGTLENTVARI
jgi:2-keto-4-pentenoate hydratase/2-oxohepta-3-ene-1,7-dioic acid hydratase in catechol pathway